MKVFEPYQEIKEKGLEIKAGLVTAFEIYYESKKRYSKIKCRLFHSQTN
jgi:hypothetical protein